MELGILLAFTVAAIKGFQSVYQRKNALGTDEFVTAFSSRAFGIPVLLAAILIYGVPDVGLNFFLLAVPQSLAIAGASILIAKAYKESEASIVTPMFAFSPLLLLFTSFFMLGEFPDLFGLLGIILITFGAYTLKIKDSKSILEPLKKLWDERGVQLIIIVVILYSVTANIDKIGVKTSSPVMWPLTIYVLSSIFMMPVMMRKSSEWKVKVRKEWKPLAILGGLGALTIILQMTAIEIMLVPYFVAIKRLSIPLTVVFSYLMLDEKDSFKERLEGSAIMVAGAVLISL
jgi:drug/metabolite transporter (DMT)-like permease